MAYQLGVLVVTHVKIIAIARQEFLDPRRLAKPQHIIITCRKAVRNSEGGTSAFKSPRYFI